MCRTQCVSTMLKAKLLYFLVILHSGKIQCKLTLKDQWSTFLDVTSSKSVTVLLLYKTDGLCCLSFTHLLQVPCGCQSSDLFGA